MVKRIAVSIFLLLLIAAPLSAKEIKFYSTSSGLMYMRVTEIIYNPTLQMDGGRRKAATKNNIFAQVMINFANLTDKPVLDYGTHPVALSVSPQRLFLVGKSGRKYSGINATKLLRHDLKPFSSKVTLKPGEDMVRAVAFHVPANDKIIKIVYKFEGGKELVIDYQSNAQLVPAKKR